MSVNLGTAYLQLEPSTDGLVPGIRKAFGAVDDAARRAGRDTGDNYSRSFGDRSKGVLGTIFSGVGMGVGMKLVEGVGGAVKGLGNLAFGSGIERALNVAGAQKKLEGLGHSADSVKTIMDDALASVKGTAFGMGDAAAVAASTVAAGVKPGNELQRTLTLVGDAATIAGSGMGEMGSVFNKVAASNKLQMDSVNQLQDRGIPVLQFVAEEMGVTGEEAAKLASQGKVSFDIFQEAMENGLGGAAQKSGETFEGAMANAKAAVGRIGANFATPVLNAMTGIFTAVIPAVDTLGAALAPLAEKFADWIERATPAVIDGLGKLPEVFGRVSEGIGWARDRFSEIWAVVSERVVPVFETVWREVQDNLLPIFQTYVGYVQDTVIPIFTSIAEIVIDTVVPVFQTIWAVLRDNVIPIFATLVGFFMDRVAPVVRDVFENVVLPAFRDVSDFITDKVLPTVKAFADYVSENVVPVVMDFADRVLVPAFEAIAGIVEWAWGTVIKPVFEALYAFITDDLAPVVRWLWEEVFSPTLSSIGDAVDNFGSNWAKVWNGIQRAAAAPVNFVIETVWNNGLLKIINAVRGLFGGEPLAKATPVSAPRDMSGYVHRNAGVGAFGMGGGGYGSPTDGVGGGGDALGGPGAHRPVPNGHSGWNGGKYRSGGYHGGLDFPAATGTPIRAMWPGAVVKALRLNRSYGHHAILDHGGGLQTLYAHMSRLGVSVGQKVGQGDIIGLVGSTGNSSGPHLHLEVRSGGRRVNPEPYLSGAVSAPLGTPDGTSVLDIPGLIGDVIGSLRELGGSGFGGLLGSAFTGIAGQVKDWALSQIGIGGYWSGTSYAQPGLAWVGERGPELVRMRGGEQVLDANQSRQATGGPDLDMQRIANALERIVATFDDGRRVAHMTGV